MSGLLAEFCLRFGIPEDRVVVTEAPAIARRCGMSEEVIGGVQDGTYEEGVMDLGGAALVLRKSIHICDYAYFKEYPGRYLCPGCAAEGTTP